MAATVVHLLDVLMERQLDASAGFLLSEALAERGVETVLGSVDGLKRFVETSASPHHGLNFCQGTVSEMLEKPGEQIYGVRFIENRGYVVTFRQIDPLYVLDLTDPADPRAAGVLVKP